MSIHILFADLSKITDPRGYMKRKLMDFFMSSRSSTDRITDLVDRVYVQAIQSELPLLAQADFPMLSEGQLRLLHEKIDMFQHKIDEISPLLIGEELLPDSDKCYILKSGINDYKAGTPVLVRKTNYATLVYFYDLAEVTNTGDFRYLSDVEHVENVALSEFSYQSMKASLGMTLWASLLMKVAEGILGAIGDKIGSELLNAIFPDQKPIDYKQMLNDFSEIVYGANLDQTISEQAGITNGVLTDNGEYYIQRKKAKAPKPELYTQLLNYHNKLNSVIGTMQYKDNKIDYTKKGLPVCVLAIDTQLAIYQELAIQDPNVLDPHQSSNVDVIRLNAPKYAEYLESKINEIVADNVQIRLNKITDVQDNPWCEGTTSGVVCKSRYYFFDNETGYKSGYYQQAGCKDDPEARCKTVRDSYVDKVRSQTTPQKVSELQWALDIAANWKKLAQSPLPIV